LEFNVSFQHKYGHIRDELSCTTQHRAILILFPLILQTMYSGSMYKVMKWFICRGCSNPVTSTGRTRVDIDASAKAELVDKFCYLDSMLTVAGDADAAVEARIWIGWNKFGQLVPLLTN